MPLMPNIENTPRRACFQQKGMFLMFGYFFPHSHARQEKRALRGAYFVFGVFFTLPLPPNSVFLTTPHSEHQKHVPMGMFSVFAVHPTHPPSPGSHKHTKCVLWDAFFMFDATTTQPFTLNTQIVPIWAQFGCSSSSSCRPLTRPRAEDLNTRMGACLGLRRPPYAPPPAPAHTNMQSASYGMCFSCSMPPPHHPSR